MAKTTKRLFKKTVPAKKELPKQKATLKKNEQTIHQATHRKMKILLGPHTAYILIPAILVVIVAILFLLDAQVSYLLRKNAIQPQPFAYTPSAYPVFDQLSTDDITAKSAVVMEVPSYALVYKKNPTLRFSMASTTKLMTAVTALSSYQLSTLITVKESNVEGSTIGLKTGEQYTVESLLYAMFLPSANDAAYALADNYPGGRQAFVNKMNENAKKLGLTNTHYTDPAGLEDDGDYTTGVDLAHLAAFAMQNQIIAQIVDTKYFTISDITGAHVFQLQNLNQLLGYQGVNGVKTGTTEGAGEVLITSQQVGKHTYIYVVMKSEDRFADTLTLINSLSGNVHYVYPLK